MLMTQVLPLLEMDGLVSMSITCQTALLPPPSVKQMDGWVLVEVVLSSAFALTPPAVHGHKLHLCWGERETDAAQQLNTNDFHRAEKYFIH